MIDVQSRRDRRKIDIKKVGVKGIQYPIIVQDRANGVQHVNAAINMYVNLPHHFKGTHMSRFIEILNEYRGQINIRSFEKILLKMREKLNAQFGAHGDRVPLLHREARPRLGGEEPDGLPMLVHGRK